VSALEPLAQRVSARDVFVLSLVAPDCLVNLAGYGRGEGWAGNITVDPTTEPWLERVMRLGVFRTSFGFPSRVFGPYWASEAAAVATESHVVVFGGPGVSAVPDDALLEAARKAAASVFEVPPVKRLADQLEITQAALRVAVIREESLQLAAEAMATQAAAALSCEFGAVLLLAPRTRAFLSSEGWRPSASDEEIGAALMPLALASREGPLVEQDLSSSRSAYRPLSFEDGLVSRMAVSLGSNGALGALVVAHAAHEPRGFTSLCQQVAARVAEVAGPVLQAAGARPAPG
jgi:hypothetical protein